MESNAANQTSVGSIIAIYTHNRRTMQIRLHRNHGSARRSYFSPILVSKYNGAGYQPPPIIKFLDHTGTGALSITVQQQPELQHILLPLLLKRCVTDYNGYYN